jgi:WD40 repeat protein
MGWPLSQDYNEAIQSPRTSFADPELRQGQAALTPLGLPLPRSGNFADVYEMTCPGGAKWAVKCFTRQVADQRERYAEISRHLQEVRLPFGVEFQYLVEGIRVRGRWYPVLKMRWVEGQLLNEFVRANADKPALLEQLSLIWVRMARRLREARVAHGDLQHGNVLLVPGSRNASLALKLIDYDGMFVPAPAWRSSGEVGHPNFQHPARAAEKTYNLKIDRFALLLVATALRALTVGGRALWERYDNGDNLLFKESDLRAPAVSPLFAELRTLADMQTQALVGRLQAACEARLEDTPFLGDLLPEEKPAPAPAAEPEAGTAEPVGGIILDVVAAPAVGPDWDFGEPQPVVGKPGGLPAWVWAVGGAVAVVLLLGIVAGIAAVSSMSGSSSAPAKSAPGARGGKKAGEAAQQQPKAGGEQPAAAPAPAAPAPDQKPEPEPQPAQPPPAPRAPSPAAPRPTLVREYPGQRGLNSQLAVSPDGKLLLSSGGAGRIQLFEVDTGKLRRELVAPRTAEGRTCIAFLPGERAVSAGADRTVRVWDLNTGKALSSTTQPRIIRHLAVSPDGRLLVLSSQGDPVVQVMDVETGKVIHRLPGHTKDGSVAAFTPDGQRLVTTDMDGVLHLWDLAPTPREVRSFRVSSSCPYVVKVTPDGSSVLVADQASAVRLFDLATGRRVREIEWAGRAPAEMADVAFPVYAADISPDGRWALVGGVGALHVCELATGREVYNCQHNFVAAAAFLPDGRRFVTGDRTIVRLWRLPHEKAPVVQVPPARPAGPPGRGPVPDAGAVAAAEKELRQAGAADLAQTDRAALQRVAEKWIDRAVRGGEAPATRLALLRVARDVALRAEHVFLVQRATDEIVRRFAVSPVGERLAAVEAALTGLGPNKGWHVFGWALDVVEEALAADEYDLAVRAAAVARAAVAKGPPQNREWVERVVRRASVRRVAFEKVRKDMETLAGRPDDSAAGAAVGRFFCYQKGDWGRGLPLLARGGDDLAALARQDLAGAADAAAQARLGDLWWARADKEGEDRAGPQQRARFWYLRALPRLGGADRERAAERSKSVVGAWQGLPGWVAEYFRDAERKDKVASRVEYVLTVPADGAPADAKAVRWTGWLWPAAEGNYALDVQPREGTEFRFYHNGRALMGGANGEYEEDKWLQGNWNIGLHLGDKPQQVRLECRNVKGPLTVRVSLRLNGGPGAARTVQTEGLYHDPGQARALGQ